jgi:hypothetical protein
MVKIATQVREREREREGGAFISARFKWKMRSVPVRGIFEPQKNNYYLPFAAK